MQLRWKMYTYFVANRKKQFLHFYRTQDVIISLPTCYGKCYFLLPPTHDKLRNMENKSIVLVVSLLVALMQDQGASIKLKGISAACLADESASTKKLIKRGAYWVLCASPEAFSTLEW